MNAFANKLVRLTLLIAGSGLCLWRLALERVTWNKAFNCGIIAARAGTDCGHLIFAWPVSWLMRYHRPSALLRACIFASQGILRLFQVVI
eukprot:6203245-Pleurochrysis_carterae.AAC.3